MIELANVTKSFRTAGGRSFHALGPVDMAVPMGSVTVVTGPSGSGKTTLLGIIGCIMRPTTGRVRISGEEVAGLPERFMSLARRERFGFVFQHFNLVRGLTAVENVMLPAVPTGISGKKLAGKANSLLERFSVGDKASVRVELLSGGEQQRVAIARSLINDPEIVIADEPTAHLDTETGQGFLRIVSELRGTGMTVILASHDPLVYASEVVDSVVRLRDGQVVGG